MKRLIILFISILSFKGVFGQTPHMAFILSYPISLPMGDLNDYTDEVSFRGITMEFTKRQKPNLDVGLEFSWHVFYKKENQKDYVSDATTISGVQYRYTNTVPMLAGVKYYPGSQSGKAKPFIGAGLGTLFVSRSTDFGLYRITTEVWQFAVRPEAGVNIGISPGIDATINAKYYIGFGTDELDGQSYLSFNLGLVFWR